MFLGLPEQMTTDRGAGQAGGGAGGRAGLHNRNLVSHHSGGAKPEIKESAGPAPPVGSRKGASLRLRSLWRMSTPRKALPSGASSLRCRCISTWSPSLRAPPRALLSRMQPLASGPALLHSGCLLTNHSCKDSNATTF